MPGCSSMSSRWSFKILYLFCSLLVVLQPACSHIPGFRPDPAAELKKVAETGDARSQLLFAHLLDEGAGVPRDLTAALGWYHKSADQGDPHACFELAKLQLSGKSGPHDDKSSVRLLFRAGEAGHTGAQALLGALFIVGRGKEAFASQVKLFRHSAEKGAARDQYTLGWILRDGAGVTRAPADAQLWLTKAARQGNAAAALLLGDMALTGEVGQKDTAAAIHWFEKAAAAGEQAAVARLSLLQKKGLAVTVPAGAPRQRRDSETGYRRLQLEFAEKQAATDAESALVAARRLLDFDPADKEAAAVAQRLSDTGSSQLAPLFTKAEQQLAAGELRSFSQSLAKLIHLHPEETRLRELIARYWLRLERVNAALEKKREALKEESREKPKEKPAEEPAASGDLQLKKGISLLEGGKFDAAARLFEKLTRTPGYTNVAGAYIYLGIASLARINMSKINEAKKLRLKGIASFQNALRFDRSASLPAGYVKYRDIFEEASSSLK